MVKHVLRTWPVYLPGGMPPMRKIRKDAFRTEESTKAHDKIREAAQRA